VYSRGAESTPKARLARSIGAAYVSSESMAFADLAASHGPIDLVYEATGAPRLAFDAMAHLDANAVCILTGVPGDREDISVEGDEIMKRLVLQNQVVVGTVNANRRDFGQAIRDLGRFDSAWPTSLREIITQRASMDQFCALTRAKDGIKSVIDLTVR
jgi:glucose 1-dehydrogenase